MLRRCHIFTSLTLVAASVLPPAANSAIGTNGPAESLRVPATRPVPTSSELHEQLDDYLTRVAAFGFSGSVLVARDEEIVLKQGYGWADREHDVPNTAETVFDIGPIAETFTAAAILVLEGRGKLHVEDSIEKYLPNVPEDKRRITLHHLLTHTSGLPGVYLEGTAQENRREVIRLNLEQRLDFEPGSNSRHSHAGYKSLSQ